MRLRGCSSGEGAFPGMSLAEARRRRGESYGDAEAFTPLSRLLGPALMPGFVLTRVKFG